MNDEGDTVFDPRDLPKEYLTRIAQTSYAQSAVDIASGDGTQVGSNIPDNKVRIIFGLIACSDNGADQNLELMQGDTTDNDRTTLAIIQVSDQANDGGAANFMGGQVFNVLFVCRPDTTSTTTGNRIAIAHETSAINVTLMYFDLELT